MGTMGNLENTIAFGWPLKCPDDGIWPLTELEKHYNPGEFEEPESDKEIAHQVVAVDESKN